ncbi:MAG: transposase, partial [Delftia sp.]|nr:transposase [Delftia sp.]
MTASASSAPAPVAFAATAAPSPPLLAHATGPTSTPLTRVSLAFLEHRF